MFFFFFKILIASLSKSLPTIISKNSLFNSKANFLLTLKLQQTIPPKALKGSQAKAFLKLSTLLLLIDTPQGLPCLTITVPKFFGRVLDKFNAEYKSL